MMKRRFFFKDYLFFSPAERRGVLILLVLILAVLLLGEGLAFFRMRSGSLSAQSGTADTMQARLDSFLASVRAASPSAVRHTDKPRPLQGSRLSPFPFNPNTADSSELCRLGLPGWMARNVVRYREAGGRFRKPADFSRIYGLTEEQFAVQEPYIRISASDAAEVPVRHEEPPVLLLPPAEPPTDTLQWRKYSPGTLVNLNRADTTELKRIPGIGSGIARRIAAYRQHLGGFYRIEQLEEINLDYTQLEEWFSIDTAALRRIPVNRAGVDRLRSHPYIDFYQAKALVEYRRKHGRLKSLKPFVLYDEFTPEDLERIAHYLSFE